MLIDELRTDPIFAELIKEFVDTLPEKIARIRGSLAERDYETVRTIAHQLKGAGGGYGFDEITSAASLVEMLSKSIEESNTKVLALQIDQLEVACDAARLSL